MVTLTFHSISQNRYIGYLFYVNKNGKYHPELDFNECSRQRHSADHCRIVPNSLRKLTKGTASLARFLNCHSSSTQTP
ncbi:Hypothetical predicted protein [Octopus vulgaris]|uniref:Uncharacterized protein n=1 Tax=Octopus vulgaris TaxID=6645 RepID=A0AA36EXF9_OCTVU|nr:Hypothetical predicted protein [Octopus vulgaris]